MAEIGIGISLAGMTHEKFHYPFYLKAGITTADIGKAVALDTAANTVDLAAADEKIIGMLVTVEDRSVEGVLVGTVALKGGFNFTIANAQVVAVGDTVIGAGAGQVKAAVAADHADNFVVQVTGSIATVVKV